MTTPRCLSCNDVLNVQYPIECDDCKRLEINDLKKALRIIWKLTANIQMEGKDMTFLDDFLKD